MLKIFTLFLMVATLAILVMCDIAEDEAKCLKEHNVSQEELRKLQVYVNQGNNTIDQKLKCFTKCVFDTFDYKDENGKMDVNKVLYHFYGRPADEMAIKGGNNCKAKYDSEKDECDYVFNIMVCLAINMKKQSEMHGST